MQEKTPSELAVSKLNLPSNATSIRADITDSEFSCENKSYGKIYFWIYLKITPCNYIKFINDFRILYYFS